MGSTLTSDPSLWWHTSFPVAASLDEVQDGGLQVRFRAPSSINDSLSVPRVCYREGSVSTKQVVFLQRPCLPQKIKKKESKVSDLGCFSFMRVFYSGWAGVTGSLLQLLEIRKAQAT